MTEQEKRIMAGLIKRVDFLLAGIQETRQELGKELLPREVYHKYNDKLGNLLINSQREELRK